MKIAIIGTGNVGGALAKQWAKSGHYVILGVRDIENFKGKELLKYSSYISAKIISEAVKEADVILIAATPNSILEIIKNMGNLEGKVIIDAMNSFRIKPEGYNHTFEALKDLCKKSEIVKCFNSTGFENLENPNYELFEPIDYIVKLDMFVAGNSEKGKEIANQLSIDAGFETCYDFGGDDKVELLEQFAMSWINLAIMQGFGRNIAFKIIRR